jgi:hypothetical protein
VRSLSLVANDTAAELLEQAIEIGCYDTATWYDNINFREGQVNGASAGALQDSEESRSFR